METGLLKQPTEHSEQVALVTHLRAKGHFVFAIPNGGKRDAISAKILQSEGVLAGVPDLCLILNNQVVWIEMKRREGGKVSEAQKKTHQIMMGLGQRIIVALGAKDAMAQLGLLF